VKNREKRKAKKKAARQEQEVFDRLFAQFEEKRKALAPPKDQRIKISDGIIARSRRKRRKSFQNWFEAAKPKPGVLPEGDEDALLAMDEQIVDSIAWASQALYNGAFWEGTTFLGYAYLSELAQRTEFRRVSEVIATEMTRKWITLQATGKTDKTEKIKLLNEAIEKFKVQDRFREIAEHDGFFGRSHLYLDVGPEGVVDDRDELKQSIGSGRADDERTKLKVGKGSLRYLKVVEPVWCYPSTYNSNDPLKTTWYNPETWFVQGKEVHVSRLLTFVGREVPDLLKPAYAFGGLSLSQMVKPYVDNWLETRQSVSNLISSFSVPILSTDMSAWLENQGLELFKRAELFNNMRDNENMMLLDKNKEDFKNVTTPLTSLDLLQAQSQEHMASACGIPLVKLLGISPAGLNATAEPEIRVFYDNIAAFQQKLFKDKLTRVINFIQLSEFGVIDPEIGFVFEPLWSLDEKGEAEVEKIRAETDAIYVDAAAIGPEDVRRRLAGTPSSPYHGLDPTDLPEQTDETADLGGEADDFSDLEPGPGPGGKPPPKPALEKPAARVRPPAAKSKPPRMAA